MCHHIRIHGRALCVHIKVRVYATMHERAYSTKTHASIRGTGTTAAGWWGKTVVHH